MSLLDANTMSVVRTVAYEVLVLEFASLAVAARTELPEELMAPHELGF